MKTKLSAKLLLKELNQGISISTLRVKYGVAAYKYRRLLKKVYSFEKLRDNPKKLPIDINKAVKLLNETQSISKTIVLIGFTVIGNKQLLAEKGWKLNVHWELIDPD